MMTTFHSSSPLRRHAGRFSRLISAVALLPLTIGTCGLALGLVLSGLALAGYPPLAIVSRWVDGSIGGIYPLTNSLADACPLLLTGLAAGIAFRGGVLNIGAQGQFLLGAMVTVGLSTRWLIFHSAPPVIILAILAGTFAGGLWALLASVLERYRSVPIVLSTILLNFVALYVVRAILQGPLQAGGTPAPQSPQIAPAYWLPVFIPFTSFHLGIPIAFVLAVLFYALNQRTTFGFESLVVGLNPGAARLAGIGVSRKQFLLMFMSGCCAGFGGALQVLGVTHFMTGSFGNYGYAGIAVALLGRLNPLGIAGAALFFGMLDTGALRVEESSLALPHAVVNVVKAVVILLMLLLSAYLLGRKLRTRQVDPSPPGDRGSDKL